MSCCSCRSRFKICAWMETSRAETGSSHTIDLLGQHQLLQLCENGLELLHGDLDVGRAGRGEQIDLLLNDAVEIPGVDIMQVPIIKGDAKSVSIAAASILAKVTRDHMMVEYDQLFPDYGFAKHKGYGTAAHIQAIQELGPCPIHRRSFIRNIWSEEAESKE